MARTWSALRTRACCPGDVWSWRPKRPHLRGSAFLERCVDAAVVGAQIGVDGEGDAVPAVVLDDVVGGLVLEAAVEAQGHGGEVSIHVGGVGVDVAGIPEGEAAVVLAGGGDEDVPDYGVLVEVVAAAIARGEVVEAEAFFADGRDAEGGGGCAAIEVDLGAVGAAGGIVDVEGDVAAIRASDVVGDRDCERDDAGGVVGGEGGADGVDAVGHNCGDVQVCFVHLPRGAARRVPVRSKFETVSAAMTEPNMATPMEPRAKAGALSAFDDIGRNGRWSCCAFTAEIAQRSGGCFRRVDPGAQACGRGRRGGEG